MLPKLPKDFFPLAGLTHVGVGMAFVVVASIVGYSQLSDCGPVMVSSNYGSAEAIEALNTASAQSVATAGHGEAEEAPAADNAAGAGH